MNMMKISLTFFFVVLLYAFGKHGIILPQHEVSSSESTLSTKKNAVEVIHLPNKRKVNILIDGTLFTSYQYRDNMEKPVLYPVYAPGGATLTRGFPLEPRPFERTDHPHHVGIWFNYGNVNGLDFWNNSYNIPEDRKKNYGTIRHAEVVRTKSGEVGELHTTASWQNTDGEVLLKEETNLAFFEENGVWIIDRLVGLTAQDDTVYFKDNKEGMIAIRVARALEFPSEKPINLTDAQGKPQEEKVLYNDGTSGNYLSSEGVRGKHVWGTRAEWMKLYGSIDNSPVAIAIIDHPQNPGYPTYWHARTYGLFAANTLGQSVFSKGKEEMNFRMIPGEGATFRYRMVFSGGDELTTEQIEQLAKDFRQD